MIALLIGLAGGLAHAASVEGVAGVDASAREIYAFAGGAPAFRIAKNTAFVPRLTGSWLGYTTDTAAGEVSVRSPGAGLSGAIRRDFGPLTVSAGGGVELRNATRTIDGEGTTELQVGPTASVDAWWSLPKAAVFGFGTYSAATGWVWTRLGGQVDVARLGKVRLRAGLDVTVQGNQDLLLVGGGLGIGLGWERPELAAGVRGGVTGDVTTGSPESVRPSLGATVWGRTGPIGGG